MKRAILTFLVLCLGVAALAEGSEDKMSSQSAIRPERLAAHVRFLAHDLLEGRGTGTRGYDLAALYVASEFEKLGLEPGDPDNGFLQRVPLRKADLIPEKNLFEIEGVQGDLRFESAVDYLMLPDYVRIETDVTADVVFAGFGITSPELDYDSYDRLDVKDRIVVLLSGAPSWFPTSERAHYSSSRQKEQNAVNHGAVGIIHVKTPVDEKRTRWDRSVRQSKLSRYRWVDPSGNVADVHVQIRGEAYLSLAGAEKLFDAAGTSLEAIFSGIEQGRVESDELPLRATMRKSSRLEPAESWNVVGFIRGSHSALSQEYVVYTAHLDHLGISDPVDGDRINNGAYDNATGVAGLIEIARAFAHLDEKPMRSVAFVAVTAEEKGLQGSDYFAARPSVSGELVANINMDMYLMLYPFTDLVALGAEHSTLGPIAGEAISGVGMKQSPDPAPEEVRFVRSDQYSFVKRGVPAVKLIPGFQSSDPSVDGGARTKEWLMTTYHSPQDQYGQLMQWESGAKLVEANFLIGHRVAIQTARPVWNEGDFFGMKFGSPSSSGE